MATRNVELSSNEFSLVTDADDFLFQNTSKAEVLWAFADDANITITPHTLAAGDAFTRNGLEGDLYVKSNSRSAGKVVVTVSE